MYILCDYFIKSSKSDSLVPTEEQKSWFLTESYIKRNLVFKQYMRKGNQSSVSCCIFKYSTVSEEDYNY